MNIYNYKDWNPTVVYSGKEVKDYLQMNGLFGETLKSIIVIGSHWTSKEQILSHYLNNGSCFPLNMPSAGRDEIFRESIKRKEKVKSFDEIPDDWDFMS